MIREALSRLPLNHMAEFGLFLFVALFLGAVLWVNRKGSDKVYKHLEEMPLEEAAPAQGGSYE